jgi:hypothetical protein
MALNVSDAIIHFSNFEVRRLHLFRFFLTEHSALQLEKRQTAFGKFPAPYGWTEARNDHCAALRAL